MMPSTIDPSWDKWIRNFWDCPWSIYACTINKPGQYFHWRNCDNTARMFVELRLYYKLNFQDIEHLCWAFLKVQHEETCPVRDDWSGPGILYIPLPEYSDTRVNISGVAPRESSLIQVFAKQTCPLRQIDKQTMRHIFALCGMIHHSNLDEFWSKLGWE